jgi:hypothetical protein
MDNHSELPRFVKATTVREILGGIRPATLRQLIANKVIPEPIELNSRLKLFSTDPVKPMPSVRARRRTPSLADPPAGRAAARPMIQQRDAAGCLRDVADARPAAGA